MDNIKDDSYYVSAIVENIKFILQHTSGITLEKLKEDEVLLDSVMFRFIQIAENARLLSEDFIKKTNSLPWHQISGIRNRIVHAYNIIKVDIIYETITNDLGPLKSELEKYLGITH